MPRAFLVKKPCVSTCKRNWSELPDEERGEIYVPGEAPRAPGSGPREGGAHGPAVGAGQSRVGTQILAMDRPPAQKGRAGGGRGLQTEALPFSGPGFLPAPRYRGRSGVCHRSGDLRLSRRKSRKPGLS